MLKKTTTFDKVFDTINYIILFILCVVTIYPFLRLMGLSFTPSTVSMTTLKFIPEKFTLEAYRKVIASGYIVSGLRNTVIRTVLGTGLTLLITIITAYPLSKKYFPNRGFWTGFIVFTMFFNGGLIPTYFVVKDLNLLNSVWALILPVAIQTFTLLIVRNFFMQLPESLEESARIDGANDLKILFQIVLPISAPIIATVVLWTAVYHWNEWFHSLIYITKPDKQVLQIVMRSIVLEGLSEMIDFQVGDEVQVNPESVKAATILVTTLPILLLYPFVQKHFVKGVLVGSLKG